jgi:hypothetical protein
LLPAEVPVPSTDFSSPITHDVFVPPPSMPRKILTSVVLSHHGDTEPRRRSIDPCYGKRLQNTFFSAAPRLRVSVVKSPSRELYELDTSTQISHCANPKLDNL